MDNVLCRRCNLKEIRDYKVVAGDSVARLHRMINDLRKTLKEKK